MIANVEKARVAKHGALISIRYRRNQLQIRERLVNFLIAHSKPSRVVCDNDESGGFAEQEILKDQIEIFEHIYRQLPSIPFRHQRLFSVTQ